MCSAYSIWEFRRDVCTYVKIRTIKFMTANRNQLPYLGTMETTTHLNYALIGNL